MNPQEEFSIYKTEWDHVLAVGVFDGVHLGHRHLISELGRHAAQAGCQSGVVTFHPHPQQVFFSGDTRTYLTTPEERVQLISALGVNTVVTLTFSEDLAAMSAREFVEHLQRYLRMRALVVGPDFALGRGREGNVPFLQGLGVQMGFEVHVVPKVDIGGLPISSTVIRRLLLAGDVAQAGKLLGRNFSVTGPVVWGARRGRTIGFPTANVDADEWRLLPAFGVYASRAYVEGWAHKAVTNIGRRPTFDNGQRSVEVHLLDFEGNLYGRKLTVELLARLRGERRFANAEELRLQINKDIIRARGLLGR